MSKSDFQSTGPDGQVTDKWIFEEWLGADDLDDPYTVDLAVESGDDHGDDDLP